MWLTGVVVVAFAGTFGGWFRPGDPWPAAASLCRSSLSRGRVWVWATHAVVLACAYRQNCAFDELPTHSWQVTSFLYEIFMHTLSFMDRNIILAFFSLLSYFFSFGSQVPAKWIWRFIFLPASSTIRLWVEEWKMRSRNKTNSCFLLLMQLKKLLNATQQFKIFLLCMTIKT